MEHHARVEIVRPRPPFDFGRTLSFACSFTPMAGEQVSEAGRWTKALRVGDDAIVADVSVAGEGGGALRVRTVARTADEHAHARAVERVRFVLSLDDDLSPFYALAARDAALAPVVRALRGLHHPKFPSALEIACWAVLAQRSPMRVARRWKDAITARWGHALEVDGRVLRAFPGATALASASERELAGAVPIAMKAGRVQAIARAFAALEEGDPGSADARLRAMPFEEAERWLGALPGIGAWSTAFVLYRGLGRMERATLEGPLLACARRVYGRGASVPSLRERAAGYGSHVGYWALYLRVGAPSSQRARAA